MLTNAHRKHTIVATLPYVTTPKDHSTARASKASLATDTPVQVNMAGLSFFFFFLSIPKRANVARLLLLLLLICLFYFYITHNFRQHHTSFIEENEHNVTKKHNCNIFAL